MNVQMKNKLFSNGFMNNYLKKLMGTGNGTTIKMDWILGIIVGIVVILAVGGSIYYFTRTVDQSHHHQTEGFEQTSSEATVTEASSTGSKDDCSCAFADTPLTPEGKKQEEARKADEAKKAEKAKKEAQKKKAEQSIRDTCSKQPLPMEGLGIAKIIVEYQPKVAQEKPQNISIAIVKDEEKKEEKITKVDKCTALELSGFNKNWTKKDVEDLMKTEDGKHLLNRIDKEYKFLTGADTLADEDIAACYKTFV